MPKHKKEIRFTEQLGNSGSKHSLVLKFGQFVIHEN